MPDPILYTAFSKSTGGAASRALGAAIRAFTGGEVNHAFLLYYDLEFMCWMTYGANANGITPLALEVFLRDREIVRIFRPRFDLWGAMRAHVADIGKHYDYRGLLGMAFVEVGRKLGFEFPNIGASSDEDFCSEWISHLIRDALHGVWLHIADDTISPTELCAGEDARHPNWFDDERPESIDELPREVA
jgi:hypothetical protein